ncbi:MULTISPECIES: nucleotidyltransferase family protein [Runella]|uniref:Polymerase nucleotidyl transferase domain-containing protein n=1 Tax=Runella defluvii TaxID=370973 RepID=A0A7W6ENJ5_9BACT|nr:MULTISPECIES: nucleotidyltransferase family protein [Runella]AYQ30906.1 hypothetical protein DTQ70_01360 [Runella sp. SP2]MBB3836564.1 hypothetical protein [Runella defluvii]HAK77498.1 hypothetical protein [Runella sp.]HAO48379.1 hypothetical protein [Runella sp.]
MLQASQKQQILHYLRPFHPTLVGVFGSYARNEQRPDSDLDILVKFAQPVNLLDIIGLEMDLSDALGIKVDLVTEPSLLPNLRPYIEKDLLLLL